MRQPWIPVAVLLASVTLWGGVRGAQAAWEALKPEPPAVVSVTVPPKATPVTRSYTLKKGDTFAGGLQALGVPNAGGVVQAAMSAHNVANVRAGDVLEVLTSGDEAAVPLAVTYNVSQDETLRVDLQAKGGPQARLDTLTYSRKPVRKTFTVEGTLWGAAIEAGLSPGDVANLVSVFEYDVDFQTELQPGANFTVVVDALYDDDGEFNRHEGLHAVKLVNRDKTYTGFRFEHANKDIAWYDKDGRQRAKPFLRNPLPFLRVTSKFSYRTDPMSRKRRFHGGVDLAASTGTPVRATGDGRVETAGWNGGYGNYIKVNHSAIGPYKTAYAHLSRIAVKKGQRVRQGDVIGYVGSTGKSTGPHLHYEFHLRGKRVDPFKQDLPSSRVLPKSEMGPFKQVRDCWQPWLEDEEEAQLACAETVSTHRG